MNAFWQVSQTEYRDTRFTLQLIDLKLKAWSHENGIKDRESQGSLKRYFIIYLFTRVSCANHTILANCEIGCRCHEIKGGGSKWRDFSWFWSFILLILREIFQARYNANTHSVCIARRQGLQIIRKVYAFHWKFLSIAVICCFSIRLLINPNTCRTDDKFVAWT